VIELRGRQAIPAILHDRSSEKLSLFNRYLLQGGGSVPGFGKGGPCRYGTVTLGTDGATGDFRHGSGLDTPVTQWAQGNGRLARPRCMTAPGKSPARSFSGEKWELTCKPGSVEDRHSSGRSVTESLLQPTRVRCGQHHSTPIWPCSGRGLPCHAPLPAVRCALTAPFHPYRKKGLFRRRPFLPAVSFLWHFPSARAAQVLPGALPYGARTFLCTKSAATIQSTPTVPCTPLLAAAQGNDTKRPILRTIGTPANPSSHPY
jgi:hypothetical protein